MAKTNMVKSSAMDLALGPSLSREPPTSLTTTLLVSNIHCASCVAHVRDVIFSLPHIHEVNVSVVAHEVWICHGPQTSASAIVKAMRDAAFEVFHASTQNRSGGTVQEEVNFSARSQSPQRGRPLRWSSHSAFSSYHEKSKSRNRLHLAYCEACQQEDLESRLKAKASSGYDMDFEKGERPSHEPEDQGMSSTPTDEPEADAVQTQDEYDAQIGVGGMTCASCANTVTAGLQELDFVKSATVNLLTNSATITFNGPKTNVNKAIEQIEDMGYDATLDELIPRHQPKSSYVANLSISGMTCGSCVGTVTRGIQDLPFVTNVVIDLLGNSGRVEFEQKENLEKIVEKIEDIGYEATVIDCSPVTSATASDDGSDAPKSRTVKIRIDGMFCHHCPQTVLDSLPNLIDSTSVIVDEPPTLEKPIVTITYTPNSPSTTIRNIINAIDSANQVFKAQVYHPPSIEERSRAMHRREQKSLLLRLLFVFIVAIPTFLIGILWMAIVPETNSIRMRLEAPRWAGSVTGFEWALLITTTPVMFYGADVFHIRALKEIRSLWRPGSRVPILRRFYRFGSMNMLISAGTAVGYFSSLAVLIIGSQTPPQKMKHTSTYFDTVVFLTLFILAGRALEAYSKAKTGDAVAMLGKLRPSEAFLAVTTTTSADGVENLAGSNNIQKISVDLLEMGDIVNVPHGASPPADGLVVDKTDAVFKFDESSLTGESMPVRKVAGNKVYSGSVNVGQPVYIQITDLGSTSMLDQIVAVVREGQTKRAPVERFADLVTGYFVPIITLIAIVTFVTWLGLGYSGALPMDYLQPLSDGWTFWSLKFAIAVFVVACPCGLALAAPTALFVGGGLAAKRGILVRGGGEAFQEASRLNAIVFDKTGTLTEGGTLRVSDHEVLLPADDGIRRGVAWALARVLEESSTHPIAQAIAEFSAEPDQQGPSSAPATILSSSISEIGGQGMKGTFTVAPPLSSEEEAETYEAVLGNQRLLDSVLGKTTDTYYVNALLSRYQSAGKSTATLAIRKVSVSDSEDFVPAIVFATSDPIRVEARQVIEDLRARNIDVHMCTGDNATTARAVASSLGIPVSNIMANVLPAQKAEYIRSIQGGGFGGGDTTHRENTSKAKARPIVAFVGDGTNDSPALAAADVSIAMASGSDVAVNSAGFILLNSDLRTILELCILSHRVFRRVKWNFLWAAIYNVILIPVAAGVFYPIVIGKTMNADGIMMNQHWRLDPVWAALAMALSSVSVVLSSLALRLDWRTIGVWCRGKFAGSSST